LGSKVDYTISRRRMVTEQLSARGISNQRILNAFLDIPRHIFVDPALGSRAYDDCSVPIGYSQTISQPYTIAFMIQELDVKENHRVLEIGTGSGYQTAILSLLGREVLSIERVAPLSVKAEAALNKIRTGKIRLKTGDGSEGWEYYAPFDRIIISAAVPGRPSKLLEQLADGGMLVAPMAVEDEYLIRFTKAGGRIVEKRLSKCAFVPLKKGTE
jgi:protein-L-isoaspartate(D-aspartate) O-methyltransferase